MHKLMAASTVLEHELSEIRLLIERQAGIVLDCPNSALAAHVAELIENQGLGSSTTVLEQLRSGESDAGSLAQVLDGLINTSSGFFRHPGALNTLTRVVLSQLYARKSADGPTPLRIWSAGCSTGEETYSIAMAVCDALSNTASAGSNGNSNNGAGKNGAARNGGVADAPAAPSFASGWPIHIVGSDLLPSNIETADRGVYPQSALTGLPPALIRASFSKVGAACVQNGASNGTSSNSSNGAGPQDSANDACPSAAASNPHLLVKPRIRSLVTFNCMNLARPGYIGRFDCIFCMDVLPHFSRVQRIALLERLHLYLEPGGYLFLGQTEKLGSTNLNFRSETFDGYTVHRKPLAASAAYGR